MFASVLSELQLPAPATFPVDTNMKYHLFANSDSPVRIVLLCELKYPKDLGRGGDDLLDQLRAERTRHPWLNRRTWTKITDRSSTNDEPACILDALTCFLYVKLHAPLLLHANPSPATIANHKRLEANLATAIDKIPCTKVEAAYFMKAGKVMEGFMITQMRAHALSVIVKHDGNMHITDQVTSNVGGLNMDAGTSKLNPLLGLRVRTREREGLNKAIDALPNRPPHPGLLATIALLATPHAFRLPPRLPRVH